MDLFDLSAKLTLDSSEYKKGLADAEKDGESFGGKVGKAFSTAGKIGAAGLAAGVAGAAALTKSAVDGYADYEQLVGGVETLFGAGGKSLKDYAKSTGQSVTQAKKQYDKLQKAQSTVLKNADKAYRTAGISANEYMEQATSTAAALVSSLGGDTEAAAEKADMAITDMADNANKMGTSMESIQNAYGGFAKGNFTMLDNLKLGFGGTKEEMERLLETAGQISGYKYDISSYSDIVDAIHVVQTEMGITGTTMAEAESTISGSLGMVKASWDNLLTSMGRGGEETKTAVKELVDNAGTALGNIIPVVGEILSNIWIAIQEAVPVLVAKIPGIVSNIATTAWNTIVSIDWLGVGQTILNAIVSAFNAIKDWATETFKKIGTAIDEIEWAEVGSTIWEGIKTAFATIGSWFTALFNDVSMKVKNIKWAEIGTTIWDNIKSALAGIVDWFADTFGGDANSVVNAVTSINWGEVGSAIWKGIKSALSTVVSWFTALYTDAGDAIESIEWSQVGLAIWNGIVSAVKGIVKWFADLFGGTGEEGDDSVYSAVEGVDWAGLGTAILDYILSAFSAIGETFGGLWEGAKKTVDEIKWAELGASIWSKITGALGNAVGGIGQWFEDRFNAAVRMVKTIKWADLGKSIWDWITGAIGGAAKSVKDWFKGKFEDAWTAVKNIKWAEVGSTIWSKITGAIGETIGGKLYDVGEWFKVKFNGAVSAIKNLDWKQVGKDLWNDIVQGISDALGDLADIGAWFKDQFDAALEDITSIDWKQLGTDIWDGIKEGFSNVGDFFAGLFDFSNISIKFPHIYVKEWWDVGPVSIPWSWGVMWYKKAYENPWLFTEPTVMGGRGFGDGNGGEMVYGHDNLMRDIREAVGQTSARAVTINVYQQPGEDAVELARRISEIQAGDISREEAVFA